MPSRGVEPAVDRPLSVTELHVQVRKLGEELIGRVTQQFVYHKLMTEMQNRHMSVIEEEVTEDRTIRIRLRGA